MRRFLSNRQNFESWQEAGSKDISRACQYNLETAAE